MYCTKCKTELEDRGHTNGGDYHTKTLGCPSCGMYYDYDSRKSNQWVPTRPFDNQNETLEGRIREESKMLANGAIDLIANDIWLRSKMIENKSMLDDEICDLLEWYMDAIADKINYLRAMR
jgi:hypothetical protein